MSTYFNNKANNPEEILDLVNEKNEVIGEVLRKVANSNPKLIHMEVAILIYDKKGRVLLQKRSKFKSINPGMWSVVAGHVTKGEDLLETAHKELQEEIGFDVKLDFVKKELQKYDWETHFMNYFLGQYSGEKITLELAEVEEARFFSKDELKKFINSGESVNLKHLGVLNEIWKLKYKNG